MPSAEESHVQMPNIEFKYIKQLQAENAELRVLLEEHQAAIEMIMTKYRQQVVWGFCWKVVFECNCFYCSENLFCFGVLVL